MQVQVFAEPAMLRPGDLKGTATVVIDALRMTSVAVTAVANGCTGILALAGVEEAREAAAAFSARTGGERNALHIEGFDFSNSPLEYTSERIGGQRLVMSTSNGTRAILAAKEARRVLLGAFINAGAVAQAVRDVPALAILCAGTLGAFTLEDVLAAGAILARLEAMGVEMMPDDMAIAARMLYDASRKDLHAALAHTGHYQRLLGHGLTDDLAYCLTEDVLQAVPERSGDGWFA